MAKIKFGTDGWRAVIGEEFTLDNVRLVAQAIADYLAGSGVKGQGPRVEGFASAKALAHGQGSRVVVGYDTRVMSEEFAQAAAQVLAGNGIKVILSERMASTPMVSLAIRQRKLSGGIMITASHNPPEFSGIKLKSEFAGPADPEITNQVEALLGKTQVKSKEIEAAEKEGLIELADLSGPWLEFVRSYVNLDAIGSRRFSVLVDSMYGAGSGYIEKALYDTGCKVTSIHREPDLSLAKVSPEPIEKNLQEMIQRLKEDGFDIGIAIDGDADRVGAVRPDGVYITSQQLLSLLLLHMFEDKGMSGSVVKTIAVTSLIDKIAKKFNLKLHETPVGFKHICKLMREEEVLIGGEESGGFGFKDFVPERDGILAGLLLLEMMAQRSKGIIEILQDMEAEFGRHSFCRQDCQYPEEKKKLLFKKLRENPPADLGGVKVSHIKTFDGAKFICEDESWLLFRLSGTEPILRIYVEAHSQERLLKVMEAGKELAFKL